MIPLFLEFSWAFLLYFIFRNNLVRLPIFVQAGALVLRGTSGLKYINVTLALTWVLGTAAQNLKYGGHNILVVLVGSNMIYL